MGRTYLFRCPACGYSAQCSDRIDCGMVAVVQPFVCGDCNQLTDVEVGERGEVYEPTKLPSGREHDFYRCGRCGSGNIKKWNFVRRICPRCGGRMSKRKDPVLDWD